MELAMSLALDRNDVTALFALRPLPHSSLDAHEVVSRGLPVAALTHLVNRLAALREPAAPFPGESVASVLDATGFGFDVAEAIAKAPEPGAAKLALLRRPVCDEMVETYPEFCERVWAQAA